MKNICIQVDREFDPRNAWVAAKLYRVAQTDDGEKMEPLCWVARQDTDQRTAETVSDVLTGFTAGAQAWPLLLDNLKDALIEIESMRKASGEAAAGPCPVLVSGREAIAFAESTKEEL
jgi:hypothetical protein